MCIISILVLYIFNPAEFLQWTCPLFNIGTVHYQLRRQQDMNFKLANQQYRAWSDCIDVQAGLALY